MKHTGAISLIACVLQLGGCSGSSNYAPVEPVTTDQTRTIARDAYLYAFAMMENYQTMYKQAVDRNAPEYVGGFNVFRHYSEPFTPANRDVVSPNNDTPYSLAWLDLRAEPIVISVPEVPKDRYYALQLVDLFTYNFGYIGVRATGFDAGDYLVAGPGWNGATPAGIKQAFRSESQLVVVIGRTQLTGPDDVANVKAIQSQYKLTPLSQFEGKSAPPSAPAIKFPTYEKAKAESREFIGYLNFLLQFCQPPYPTEVALRKRFEKIGVKPAAAFDPSDLSAESIPAIDAGIKDAQAQIKAKIEQTHGSNGIFGSRDVLGDDYLKRDAAAAMGLYGNSIEEAWYGGGVGDGNQPSKIHFPHGQLPPAKFFWSVTLYTLPDRFLYDNPINRYSIGDRTPDLKYDAEDGLTIYISHNSPSPGKETNWLPAPAGQYSYVVRVYGPAPLAISGEWKLPPLENDSGFQTAPP
ncbi:MAG TPA: DUF1254 domain-containing protein [Tepidisphaeraceae bacterium]|jgi:hypothetical protein